MSARRTTEDERALFRAALSGQTPVKAHVKAPVKKPRPPKLTKPAGGLDGRTKERLTRGEVAPDAKLDLHGMTEAAAHRALSLFLHSAARRGDRLVLVVTGKGAARPPDAPFDLELGGRSRGVLKAMVPRWLGETALARLVAALSPAHRRHGGDGALYVYLRKSKN